MSGDHSWTPLIEGPRQHEVLDAARDVVASVAAVESEDPRGAGEIAVLLAYAANLDLVPDIDDVAAARLDALVASLAEPSASVGLWGGLAGVSWTVGHLAESEDADEVCTIIEEALHGQLDGGTWNDRYDLISGLVGIGVAMIDRLGQPSASRVATRVLDHLEASARRDAIGLAWFTPPALLPEWQQQLSPEGHYNLGLAHGVPGVIGLMAAFVAAGFETERARRLLDGAVGWMRGIVAPRDSARFPAWWGPGVDTTPARLAWCYGDPGVAVTLLAAARALGDGELEAEAIAMGHAMAARPFESSGVIDTGICHGAAGVAHILNRMYQATGDAILGDAARGWIDRLLAMRRTGEPHGGFPALQVHDGEKVWVPDPGIIMGGGGVALVLLAAATDVEPAWDQSLLVGVPR